jgi:hypothetical protein
VNAREDTHQLILTTYLYAGEKRISCCPLDDFIYYFVRKAAKVRNVEAFKRIEITIDPVRFMPPFV